MFIYLKCLGIYLYSMRGEALGRAYFSCSYLSCPFSRAP